MSHALARFTMRRIENRENRKAGHADTNELETIRRNSANGSEVFVGRK